MSFKGVRWQIDPASQGTVAPSDVYPRIFLSFYTPPSSATKLWLSQCRKGFLSLPSLALALCTPSWEAIICPYSHQFWTALIEAYILILVFQMQSFLHYNSPLTEEWRQPLVFSLPSNKKRKKSVTFTSCIHAWVTYREQHKLLPVIANSNKQRVPIPKAILLQESSDNHLASNQPCGDDMTLV